MRDIKKVIIAGGTGFLGYAAAEKFLERNIKVDIITLKDELNDLSFVDKRINILYCDIHNADEEEISKLLKNKGYDALIYALGPDDRITPNRPAYQFFYDRLVLDCKKTLMAAKNCKVKHAVVLGSYFSHFNKKLNGKLAKSHPYIRCRAEQQQACYSLCDDTFSASVLELPYIFGLAEGRVPIWKDSFLKHFDGFKSVFFPKGGGTAIISRDDVAKAVVACTLVGESKTSYPIATDNILFKELVRLMLDGLNDTRKVIEIPGILCKLGTYGIVKKLKKQGKEAGLYYPKVMTQIMSKKFFINPEKSMDNLKFKELGYAPEPGIKKEIVSTMNFFVKKSPAKKSSI